MEDHASASRRFKEPRSSWKACIALVAVALLCCAGMASAAIDKNAAYQEMNGLAAQMKTLKPQIGVDAQSRTTYGTLAARYHELSALLGGDDPGHVGGGSGAAAQSARLAQPTKVVPTTPAGCGTATATFTQSTPTAIPTGPAVVTSTVVVSGVGTYLFDLDVTTFLTHTFAADLDITIMSPMGTIVTLTTDNGAGNDNVFNGTVWDDDANPAGQVPYTTNNGMVTDHAYVNLTLASPLTPEEGLGAFIGEDPNGTWTITISDDLAGDGGSLDSWSLGVTTFPSAPTTATTTATQSTPVAIPTGPAVVTSTVVIAGAGTSILDVDLTTFLTHTFAADLDITIMSPMGTIVTLTTDNGAGNDNTFNGTVWNDDANPAGQVPYTTNNGMVTDHAYVNLTLASPLTPEEPLAAFIGEDPNGTWTITISDDLAGDGGSLDSWTLDIDTFSCTSADVSVTKTDNAATAVPGTTVTYTIVVMNNGPSPAPSVNFVDNDPATDTFTSVASGGATGNTAGPASGPINETLNLPAGSSVTYTLMCPVPPGATGTLVNTATASSTTPDPNPANNSATDTDTLTPMTDLVLMKTSAPSGNVTVGTNVVFTLKVTNNGPSNATGVVVTDTLPAGLTYVSNDCGAAFAAPTLTWNVGALAAGAMATCNLTATVTQGGPIINTASATGNETDPTPTNNTAVPLTIVGVVPMPGIPTLGGAGLAALIALLAMSAAFLLRRKRQV